MVHVCPKDRSAKLPLNVVKPSVIGGNDPLKGLFIKGQAGVDGLGKEAIELQKVHDGSLALKYAEDGEDSSTSMQYRFTGLLSLIYLDASTPENFDNGFFIESALKVFPRDECKFGCGRNPQVADSLLDVRHVLLFRG
jgi:hypothetical protein